MRSLFITFLLGVNCLINLEIDLILTFLEENDVKYCFFLVCWTDPEKVNLSKTIMKNKLDTRTTFLSAREGSISEAITRNYSEISYILDLSCDETLAILNESSQSFKFTLTNSWLMLAHPDMALEDVKSLFGKLELRLDMDVKIAIPQINESQYDIYEIYDLGLDVDYKFDRVGFYKGGAFSYPVKDKMFFQSRRNMSGVLVRIGNVVNITAELISKYKNLADYNENGGLATLYFYYEFKLLVELLKFRYNVSIAYPWFGYANNGTDGGVGKLLYEKKIDLHVGGGMITVGRLPWFEPLFTPYVGVKSLFVYRSPGIKKPGAQVLSPLASEVWYYVLATTMVTGALVKVVYWAERKFLNSNDVNNFFTSVMTVVSVLTQQGSTSVPRRLGGRVLFLSLLIFSIGLYNYYTSGLVSSLLNSTPEMLTTFQDLYKSHLEIGMEDLPYAPIFLNRSRNRYARLLYRKKIGVHPGNSTYSVSEGLEKVRKGGFAYHTMTYTAYAIISRTFDQEAICDLGEIPFLDAFAAMYVKKKSQYKELLSISLTKLWESGLSKRTVDYTIIKRPECRSNLLLTAVGSPELYLVYLIFVAGVFLAIATLSVEILYHKIKMKNRAWHR